MSVTDLLLRNAHEDTQLLIKNDGLGDDFSVVRDVDFVLRTSDQERADLVCSFITDNQYGVPRVEEGVQGQFRIVTTIEMPTTQHLVCGMSGLMVCLGALFDVEYEGWGCVVQNR